jgi:hypothetical protein
VRSDVRAVRVVRGQERLTAGARQERLYSLEDMKMLGRGGTMMHAARGCLVKVRMTTKLGTMRASRPRCD